MGANFAAIGRLQMDLIVLALSCDLTRVASVMFSNSLSDVSHRQAPGWLDGEGGSQHYMVHTFADDDSRLVRINTWYASQFAYLLAKMKAQKEPDGSSLLDHSLLFWPHEIAIGKVHDGRNTPYLLAGKLGGALKAGRYLQYGGQGRRNNDLLISILNAFGVSATTFGKPEWCHGALPGLV